MEWLLGILEVDAPPPKLPPPPMGRGRGQGHRCRSAGVPAARNRRHVGTSTMETGSSSRSRQMRGRAVSVPIPSGVNQRCCPFSSNNSNIQHCKMHIKEDSLMAIGGEDELDDPIDWDKLENKDEEEANAAPPVIFNTEEEAMQYAIDESKIDAADIIEEERQMEAAMKACIVHQ